MKKSIIVLIFLFVLAFTATSQAGTQLSGLMGKDVTDPGNKISEHFTGSVSWGSAASWEARYEDATWLSISSYRQSPYGSLESPSNLFNNGKGGSYWKWNDSQGPSTTNPSYVTVQFPEAFVLTHFTLSSANDSWEHNRQPGIWTVYGSNDGVNWTSIYHASSAAADFTNKNETTILYSSFTNETLSSTVLNADQQAAVTSALGTTTISSADYTTPAAYSWYKLEITKTEGSTGTSGSTQLGEWELYGNTIAGSRTSGNTFSALKYTMSFADSLVHLDAQNDLTLTKDESGNVSAWADSNGNGVIFSQTNTKTQPTMTTLKVGEKEFRALDFSRCTPTAETDNQGGDNLLSNKALKAKTVIILAQNDINTDLMGIFGQNSDDGLRLNSSSGLWQHTQSNDFAMGGTHTYNGLDESEFGEKLLNNLVLSQVTTKEGDYNNWSSPRLGSYFSITQHGSRGYDGKILEVVVYDRALTDYETKLVNTGFAMKYGLKIANTLDVFPTESTSQAGTMSTNSLTSFDSSLTYRYDMLGIINRTIDGKTYSQLSSGEGGLGIYGAITATREPVAGASFDIFLTTYETSSEGAEIYALSNVSKDASFGIVKDATGIKYSTYDKWAKEWYFSNKSTGDQDWDITLEFNADVAQFTDYETYKDEDWYLISKTEADGEYFRVADMEAQKFNEKMISFTFPASLLQTGYYTLGVMTSPELPEPAAWVMILLGIAGIWKVKSGRRQRM